MGVGSRAADPDGEGAPTVRSLTIGEVARRTGFSVKALRFYERRGLLPAAGRSPGGFRLYTDADLHRLEFIRQAKALGLSLAQIRQLVVTARQQTCPMTRPLLLHVLGERIRQTSRQMEALTWLRGELRRRRRALRRRPPTDHGRGYCACFERESRIIPVSRIRPQSSASPGPIERVSQPSSVISRRR